jgi:hypothetical protein
MRMLVAVTACSFHTVCLVCATRTPTGLDQAPLSQVPQQCVEQEPFSLAFNQTRAKLAQDCVVEARIGQRQAECILPVDPSAHRVSGLPIGQALHVLQHGREGEPARCFGGLAAANSAANWLSL